MAPAVAAESWLELDPKRIDELAALLPEGPSAFAHPHADRAFWTAPATVAGAGPAIAEAEQLLGKSFPPWSDELYLEFSRIGRRPPGERMLNARSAWLRPLVLAECLEDRGRFLPALAKALGEYVDEPTWTMPAHDGRLDNFKRKAYSVDLRSSRFGFDLATTVCLLGDRLDAGLRQRLLDALEQRLFAPLRASFATGKGNNWLGNAAHPVQNNWNPVCLSGVVGAALAVLPARHDRAVFVAAGEHYPRYYLNSFREDGYCDEGAGYWNYGFGDFVVLREELVRATGGAIELLADPRIRAIALYGPRIQLLDRLAPPFADCRPGTQVDAALIDYCDAVLGLGLRAKPDTSPRAGSHLGVALLGATPLAGGAAPGAAAGEVGLRTWFDRAGVLICRPAPGAAPRLAAAIKGGGNGSHSHNDIGSFVICQDGEMICGDPGGPVAYDGKTFGPQRFSFKLLNSFGHPVPVVAGQLQRDATTVKPAILASDFAEGRDEIRIDLAPAYASPELTRLVRTLRYARGATASVTVEDEVAFRSAQAFEVALPTRAAWRSLDATTLELKQGAATLIAHIECTEPVELVTEAISELDAPPFTRIGLRLTKPVTTATLRMVFSPAP
jgi:hypothetical protein